jgi:5,6-dimethylbenzimidazole synthase
VPDALVPEDVLARLLHAAHSAPSVGLMQPWRFIRITDPGLRTRIHAIVDEERLRTAEALGPRADEFLALKVEGILECAELFVVALCEGRQTHVFGRRTLPQMDLASVDARPSAERLRLGERLGRAGTGLGWCSCLTPPPGK